MLPGRRPRRATHRAAAARGIAGARAHAGNGGARGPTRLPSCSGGPARRRSLRSRRLGSSRLRRPPRPDRYDARPAFRAVRPRHQRAHLRRSCPSAAVPAGARVPVSIPLSPHGVREMTLLTLGCAMLGWGLALVAWPLVVIPAALWVFGIAFFR